MKIELALFVLVLAAGVAVAAGRPRGGRRGVLGLALLAALLAGGLGQVVPTDASLPRAASHRPLERPVGGYVGSDTCRACHPHQYETWHRSYHRTMTQVASPASVLGDFDRTFDYEGARYRLERDGDEYWVEIELALPNRPGETLRVRKPVVLTTGSHHMQAYWYASERTRELVALPFAFLREERRWVPRISIFLAPPEVRWGMELGAWNSTCIKCHTTNGRPRIREVGDVDSEVSEFGIACESCHGPAAEHVRVNRDPVRRYAMHWTDGPDETVVQPARLDGTPSSHVCGQCHAVTMFRDAAGDTEFRENGFPYRPGDDLRASRAVVRPATAATDPEQRALLLDHPSFRAEDQFWSDGMVRVSGREFSGMMESPCFKGGDFSCVSCHTMHLPPDDPRSPAEWADDQLILGMDGDEACLQCHDKYRANLPAHTFHKPESTGSRCYNCHNPYTTYGLMKAIRSHQVSNPTATESVETGRPNACNQCHLDKTLGWTAEYLEKWYKTPQPVLGPDEREIAAAVLWTLEGDAGQRALMAWSFGWDAAREASGTSWTVPYLAQLMLDPYHTVRYIAGRSLARIEGFEDLEFDHMADRAALARVNRGVIERWRSIADPRTGAELLVQSDGTVALERYRGVLARRNHRPVFLKE